MQVGGHAGRAIVTAPTLLERRREQRDRAIADALDLAVVLRECVDVNASDLRSRVDALASAAADASHFAALVADLEDVADYGAGGGRT